MKTPAQDCATSLPILDSSLADITLRSAAWGRKSYAQPAAYAEQKGTDQHPCCILLRPFFYGFAQGYISCETDGPRHALACCWTPQVALGQPTLNVAAFIPERNRDS